MIIARRVISLQPAPKLAGAMAVMAAAPALVLLSYQPPIAHVVTLLLVSLAVAVPAIRKLWRPQMALVISGTELLAHDRTGRLAWRAQRPRAVVTPWALSIWSPFQPGVTVFRGQVSDADYRRLAAWLHR